MSRRYPLCDVLFVGSSPALLWDRVEVLKAQIRVRLKRRLRRAHMYVPNELPTAHLAFYLRTVWLGERLDRGSFWQRT